MRILPPIIAAVVLCASQFAYADKVLQYKPPTQFEASEDFYVIEGAGLFQSGSPSALNVSIWQGSERSEITRMVKEMPVNSRNPVVRDMIQALLLSESNTNEMLNFDAVAPGDDLLTLRIYKLIEGGFYNDALELYSVAIESPHHEAIAKVGILAMLGSGEKSIACLEMKTLGAMNAADDFWSAFTAYCDYTLTDEPNRQAQSILENTPYEILRSIAFNDSFIFPYSIEGWNSLSLLEQNILVAEGRIEAPVFDKRLLNKVPPRDMSALLSLKTINPVDRAALSIKAHEWGLVSADEIGKAYESITEPSIVLGGLPGFYQRILVEDDAVARNEILMQVLAMADKYGFSAIMPFAQDLANSTLTDLSDEQMRSILWVFYLSDVKISPEIIENYIRNAQDNIGNNNFSSNMQAIPLVLKMPRSHDLMTNMQNMRIFHKNPQEDGEFVIEQLDNSPLDDDNADKVYEKGVDAAVQKRHDNASDELLMQLNHESREGALGKTVLLSIKLLSDQSIRAMNEGYYSDVIEALEKADLKELSRKMAIERHIGD